MKYIEPKQNDALARLATSIAASRLQEMNPLKNIDDVLEMQRAFDAYSSQTSTKPKIVEEPVSAPSRQVRRALERAAIKANRGK